MAKKIINTPNAPAAIGTYSQAVKVNDTVYITFKTSVQFRSAPP